MTITRPAELADQLCFALYATSRAVTGTYRAGLAEIGLTYPQYLTMLVLWGHDGSTVGELGRALDLDSGTLSPILRRLQTVGYLRKERSNEDERTVRVYLTDLGRGLEAAAGQVRRAVEDATGLTGAELADLRTRLHELRHTLTERHPAQS